MPRLIEKFLLSKTGSQDGGEDRLIINDDRFYGVVDGATDQSGINWATSGETRTGGATVADILVGVFANAAADIPPEHVVKLANEAIHRAASAASIDLSNVHNRANAGFAVYSLARNQVMHIHDCAFGFVSSSGEFRVIAPRKLVDELTTSLRVRVIEFLRQHGIDPLNGDKDLGREFIIPLLKRQSELQNISFQDRNCWAFGLPCGMLSFRTINGFETSLSVTDIPEGTKEIVLASDGFRVLRRTLAETLAELDQALALDPNCVGVIRGTKRVLSGNRSFDDMSYVRVAMQ